MRGSDADRRVEAFCATRYGILSRREATQRGMTHDQVDRRVASGRWIRLDPGVYRLSGVPATWHGDLLAALLWAGPGSMASHRSSARLWRMEGFEEVPVEILTRSGHRRTGMIVHRLRPGDRPAGRRIDGIPTTSADRTLLDLAAVVDGARVGLAVDDALRRRLVTLPRLRHLLEREGGPGRTGTSALRRLLAERDGLDARTESELERRLLRLLRRGGLPPPVPQHEVRNRGRLVARLDFAYPELRLGIETHGYRFHSGRERWQRDLRRENRLKRAGWTVLVYTWDDVVADGGRVVEEVGAAIAERAAG